MLVSGADPSEASASPRLEAALTKGPSGKADLAELARTVFDGMAVAKGILLAVSGGPDSTALLLLAAAWAADGVKPPLFVATVDHRLRPESLCEAETVGRWAHELGLAHKILVWESEKPRSRVQERARAARYDLLCAHAADIGADHLVTAHHADDQAETILFRLLRGSGLKGLGGMKAVTPRQNLSHARPLLGLAKADLIALCESQGQSFFEDPSNRNPAYARTRLKALTKLLAENGLDREAFLRLGSRLAKAEAALAEQAEASFRLLNLAACDGGFEVDIAALVCVPDEIFERVLGRLVTVTSGREEALRLDRLEALAARLKAALIAGEGFAATLGGTAMRLSRQGVLQLRREPPRSRGVRRTRSSDAGNA